MGHRLMRVSSWTSDHLDIEAACNGGWAYPMSNEAAFHSSLSDNTFETVTHSQEHGHKRRRIKHSDEDQCTPDQDVLEDDDLCDEPSNVFADDVNLKLPAGLTLLNFPRDRNCFWHALALQLNQLDGQQWTQATARTFTVNSLLNSDEDTQNRYAELAGVENADGLADSLVRVGEYAGWGGNHLLVIVTQKLNFVKLNHIPFIMPCAQDALDSPPTLPPQCHPATTVAPPLQQPPLHPLNQSVNPPPPPPPSHPQKNQH
ncbi:hypothetical protein BJ741DRAFT_664752 [Chytriomyces cf. hyalinus JEL632]|nr:hypothetical protein BJ741DRAFT_664752 [Chytriomyces cf. hyalinus JEL632]